MNGRLNLGRLSLPVLDIWGGVSRGDSRCAAERRDLVLATCTQTLVAGAHHSFKRYEDKFTSDVVQWLRTMSDGTMAASSSDASQQ